MTTTTATPAEFWHRRRDFMVITYARPNGLGRTVARYKTRAEFEHALGLLRAAGARELKGEGR